MTLSGEILTCVIFMLMLEYSFGQTQKVQISAPSTFKLKKEPVKIDCQPVAGRFSVVNNIALNRATSTSSSRTIAAVKYDRTQGSVTNLTPVLSTRATVTGTVDSALEAQLSLTIPMQNTQCSDEGIYTCFVSGDSVPTSQGVTTVLSGEVSQNVSVIVEPDGMEQMTASPPPASRGQYKVGDNITLSCKGTVGSYQNPLSIVWCVERTTDNVPFPITGPQISQSEVQPTGPGSCQYFRTSTMLYTVTEKDTFTKFICQITRRSAPDSERICGVGTYNSSLNIETVIATTTTTATSGEGGDAASYIGAIVGGVIGAIVFLSLVVVVVVMFVIFMKRRNIKETPRYLQSVTTIDTRESPCYSNEVHVSNSVYYNVNDSPAGGDKNKDYEELHHQREMHREYAGLNVNTDGNVQHLDTTIGDAKSKDYEKLQCQREMRTEYEGLNVHETDPAGRDERRDDTYEMPIPGPDSYVNTF